jgi:hypothetical protein
VPHTSGRREPSPLLYLRMLHPAHIEGIGHVASPRRGANGRGRAWRARSSWLRIAMGWP